LQAKSNQPLQGFLKPLDETFTWHKDYYDTTKYVMKRKKLFVRMKGAKRVK
jgi:hypothetical protein